MAESDLAGIHTVPALIAVAIILVAIAAVGAVCAWASNKVVKFDSLLPAVYVFGAVTCTVSAIALLFTAVAIEGNHWDNTCHHRGGVVVGDSRDVCVKPHSEIHVP